MNIIKCWSLANSKFNCLLSLCVKFMYKVHHRQLVIFLKEIFYHICIIACFMLYFSIYNFCMSVILLCVVIDVVVQHSPIVNLWPQSFQFPVGGDLKSCYASVMVNNSTSFSCPWLTLWLSVPNVMWGTFKWVWKINLWRWRQLHLTFRSQ